MTSRTEFSFFHPLRVRWAEVDLQRVVFNGNYLLYFDVAFTEYWRYTGLPDPLAQQAAGTELFVRKAQIEYHGSAGFDDELQIGVRCARLGRSSMTMAIAIFRADDHLIDGELTYVYADAHEKKSVPIPDAWRQRIATLERTPPDGL
ncbi:MAG: acyl-CoA thioesterase [Burkholderiales bacterium]|nr:acyl-CoA thioesterase [Burkholderiales bacterium]